MSIPGIDSLPITLRRFCEKNAHKIDWVSNEQEENQLYWISLRAGYYNAEANTTSIQESTVRGCIAAFNSFVLPVGQALRRGMPAGPC